MTVPRITKRKLDDAIQTLDDILNPSNEPLASPKKRPNTSLYRTFNNLFRSSHNKSNSTSRTASATPISRPFALSSKPLYRPDSTVDFLARLSSFKLATYRNKPDSVNAVAAAKAGWTNEGKDRLGCGYCSASWVLASTQGMSKDAAHALTERHRQSLVTAHKETCPWRKAQCEDSIYRIPLKGATAMAKQIKLRALALTPFVKGINLKHPLSSEQVSSVMETLSAVPMSNAPLQETNAEMAGSVSEPDDPVTSDTPQPFPVLRDAPSEVAYILSIFGWELGALQPPTPAPSSAFSSFSRATASGSSSHLPLPRTPTSHSRHTSSISLSRASGQPLQVALQTPSHSLHRTPSQLRTPQPTSSLPDVLGSGSHRGSRRKASGGSGGSAELFDDKNIVLVCELCQRRIGLWSFLSPPSAESQPATPREGRGDPNTMNLDSPQSSPMSATFRLHPEQPSTSTFRELNVLKEHRSFCPYVVKTTSIPTPAFSVPFSPNQGVAAGGPSSLRRSISLLGRSSSTSLPLPSHRAVEDPSLVEGWRAVYNIVSRYGMGMRMRRTGSSSTTGSFGLFNAAPGGSGRTPSISFAIPRATTQDHMDVDETPAPAESPDSTNIPSADPAGANGGDETGIEKIVENVKKHREGSRELLRYVKELLRRGDPGPSATVPDGESDTPGCMPRRHSSGTFRLSRNHAIHTSSGLATTPPPETQIQDTATPRLSAASAATT